MIKIIYAMMNHRKEEGFEDNLIFNPGEYEIMIFQTPVLIEVDGVMSEYPEHTCILYKPGQKVHYRAVSGELLYDWIRFDCDEPLYTNDFLPFGQPVQCTNYNGYFVYWQAVANENYWVYGSSKYVCEQLMHIIFHHLHDYAYHSDANKYRDSFMSLRGKIYQFPANDWSLEHMASTVHLSVRSLQKLYKDFFHISCINEVIVSRTNHAKVLLLQTNDSIAEVCEQCGYNNQEHFCRQFKKQVGMTPTQYRKLSQTT